MCSDFAIWNVNFLFLFKLKIGFCAATAFRFNTAMSLERRYGSSSYLALKISVNITCCSILVAKAFLELLSNIY